MIRSLTRSVLLLLTLVLLSANAVRSQEPLDPRLDWWREARFGLIIHWGLYAIPAGEWKGKTNHGEWIMHSARIPVPEYEKFLGQFNPVKFDADTWVRAAKNAGMRYIVITSKHHDGFALYDSLVSDYDVMATPFRRDILAELAAACTRHDVRLCFYHSIMDWHHPDYLPRRGWEKRSAEGADYERYVAYMKAQVRELLTSYEPGVMWFDGEWESTWTHAHGLDLYAYCKALKPNVIVNNRVDKGRGGMAGLTAPGYVGDFGTPEQEIPDRGIPDADWETCMTMNRHWGWNKADDRWKSSRDLIRKLADIASKGGNFLLNVGPTDSGEFPAASLERLAAMGRWMKVNGAAVYGTKASPLGKFDWGRCTYRPAKDGVGARLYLHVFERPESGVLRLPGLLTHPEKARLLAAPDAVLTLGREDPAVTVKLPEVLPDADVTIVELLFKDAVLVVDPPAFDNRFASFVIETVLCPRPLPAEDLVVHYTLDGSEPTAGSPAATEGIPLDRSAVVTARIFRGDRPVSEISRTTCERAVPREPAPPPHHSAPGWLVEAFEGSFKKLPDFDELTPLKTTVAEAPSPRAATRREHVALRFTGWFEAPADGIYRFTLTSDDGSAFDIGGATLIDHDGLHGRASRTAEVALKQGFHPVTVRWFNTTGSATLELWFEREQRDLVRQPLAAPYVRHPALSIIPAPKSAQVRAGTFCLGPDTRLVAGPGTEAAAERLAEVLRRSTGFALPVKETDAAAARPSVIELRRVKDGDMPPEAYRLEVTPARAIIEAAGDAGLFYGTVTLRQLFPPAIERPELVSGVAWAAPCCTIEDAPRFGWRGLMIDSCRHFQPKAWVLKLLERMAYYKLNRFHWHLTEDEAWRLEIHKYPELTQVGAWRGDGAYRYGGYFTQDDVREVVARAAELHITVVPEIEMPGHCMAALVARPSLSCAGKPIPVGRGGLRHFTSKVRRLPYCAGREETFTFLEDVLTETLALFPSPWIHIGGDERPRGAWKSCELCRQRIRDQKLANEDELQSWFVRRIERFLNAKGRRLIGWDEILQGGLAPNATVMSWRGVSGGIAAARAGHDVIMSPTSHCYFDYWQGDSAVEPAGRGHRITPELVYDFEPVPEALTGDAANHVLGAQANVWTEYMGTPELVDYMTFPRILALAEVVWTPAERRSWDGFRSRLSAHYARLSALGVDFRVPPPTGLEGMNLVTEGSVLELASPVPGGVIRWVRGRRVPNQDARRYAGPLPLEEESAITARLYLPNGRASRPVTGEFQKAVWLTSVDPGETAPGLDAAYFEGKWTRCADLKRSNPVRRGTQAGIGLPVAHRPERFGCVLSGFIRIQQDDVYTFGLTADDGSRLYLGDRLVIDNDGLHGSRERTAQAALRAGYHPIRVEYFQVGGPAKLLLTIGGGGLETQPVPEAMLVR